MMNGFCGSTLWDTVLIWVPCAFLWLTSPFEIYRIKNTVIKNRNRVPWTLVSLLKLVFTLILTVLSFLELINASIKLWPSDSSPSSHVNPVEYYTPSIKLLTFSYVAIIICLSRRKAINSSGVLFFFWFLFGVSSAVTYRSIFINLTDSSSETWMLDKFGYICRVVSVPLILAQFVLSTFSESLPFAYIEPGQEIHNPSPEWTSSFLSTLTFWWMNPLILLGYKRPLKQEDLYDLSGDKRTATVFKEFSKSWTPLVTPSIVWPLYKTYWSVMLKTAAYKFFASLLMFVSPIVLDNLLVWMVRRDPLWQGFFYVGLMFSAAVAESILNNLYEYNLALTAMKMRSAVTDAIYQKALRLSPTARNQFTTGQITNLMSVDANRIIEFISFVNVAWSSPLQISIAVYLLWQQLGAATLAGVGVMLFLIPFNGYITSKWRQSQQGLMKHKDKRAKLINEILSGIKVLKLYGWEPSFAEQVRNVRGEEIRDLRRQSYYMSAATFSLSCAPIFVALFSFTTFTLIDKNNILDASKAFVSLSLFNILRMPLTWIPLLITFGTMFFVSMKRINKYLNCEETDLTTISYNKDPDGNAVKIKNGTFSWTHSESDISLRSINLEVKEHQLVAVVGTVGSGKSSLLSSLLGDMNKMSGSVNISGSLAYVPQQAWIQNATLRQNIIFTSEYEEHKYNEIIDASALTADMKILAAGDETEIGEKGINLSGGQKQRVSLARAIYANSDIYLLDDPLSAVDSHVGKHIFDKVIGPNGLLKNKTRILVTHKIALLPQVDMIVVMKDGRISEKGTYHELLARKGDFAEFLVEYLVGAEDDIEEDETIAEIKTQLAPVFERHMSRISAGISSTELRKSLSELSKSADSGSAISASAGSKTNVYYKRQASATSASIKAASPLLRTASISKSTPTRDVKKPDADGPRGRKANAGRLTESEMELTGGVSWSVYLDYFKSVGIFSVISILISTTIANAFNIGSSLWLSVWSSDSMYPDRINDTALRDLRLGVYGALGISESLFLLISNVLTFLGTLTASSMIHDLMMDRILRAPMSFFDTTPMGRVLNRFTKDIDAMDMSMRMNIRQFVNSIYKTIVTLIVVSLQTPLFLLAVLPLSIVYYVVQRFYIRTSRQLRRVESNTRSPVYNHFSETVTGASCIKAFGAVEVFRLEAESRIDSNSKSFVLAAAASRWLAVRLEFVGNIIVLLAALFAVTSLGSMDPSLAGLSISYALTVTATLNMLVRSSADLENNLVSVERCLEYTKIGMEKAWYNSRTKPNDSWPDQGYVKFDNYSTRYRDGLDLVLQKVCFESKSNEKIGIVGRTGAGKSSLTLALFRIVEPAEGTIIIDNVDISKLGLQDLRSKLTIIPQDPFLFTGTLRKNLDPFSLFSDSEVWTALDLAHLKEFASGLEGGLEFQVAEGGDNLSVGQRQLVCLARAVLRKSKILILDEATAAVDLETDDLIQKTIRNEFSGCTIITIAHRLNTVMDYDRILVMDVGQVAEFDTPQNLLSNHASKFFSMAKDAGLTNDNNGANGTNGNNGGGDQKKDKEDKTDDRKDDDDPEDHLD